MTGVCIKQPPSLGHKSMVAVALYRSMVSEYKIDVSLEKKLQQLKF